MSFILWAILFYVIGFAYLVDWIYVASQLRKDKWWVMFTPIWPFATSYLPETARRASARAMAYYLAAIALGVLKLTGSVDSPP